MTITEEVQKRVDAIAKEKTEFTETLKASNVKCSYEDSMTIFFMAKIAQLELEIENLKKL